MPFRQDRMDLGPILRHFPKPVIPGKPNPAAVRRYYRRTCEVPNCGDFPRSCPIAPDQIQIAVPRTIEDRFAVRGPDCLTDRKTALKLPERTTRDLKRPKTFVIGFRRCQKQIGTVPRNIEK